MSIDKIIEREFPQTQFPHYAPRFEKHKLRALLLEAVEAERKDAERYRDALIVARGAAQCAKAGIRVNWDELTTQIDAAIAAEGE